MSKRLKSTPFARFFVAMLFIAPLAYIGAAYMNGNDGIQSFKNLFSGQKTEMVQQNDSSADQSPTTATSQDLEKILQDLEYKNKRIEELLKENEMLKEKNAALEKQVADNTQDIQ